MHLHPTFQTAITGAILVQSLQNKDFINPIYTSNLSKHALKFIPTTVTHPLRSDTIFILFQSETPLPAVSHFVYHVMLIHHLNRQKWRTAL